MLKNIYLIALGILVIPVAFLTWYAGNWLHSIGNPKAAEAEYFYYSGLGGTILIGSFILLLVMANVILWTSRRAWAIWLAFLYFSVFVFLRFWWLEGDYLDFARRNSLTESTFSLGPIIAVVLVIGVGAFVFFDQFIVLRLAEKMHPVPADGDSVEEKPGVQPPAEES